MDILRLYELFLAHPVVTTDSRDCPEGSMFFALKGETFDGNAYAAKALASGCKSEAASFAVPLVLRTGKAELFERYGELKPVLSRTPRLNVVITDVETFTDEDFGKYKAVLSGLSAAVEQLYADGKSPQLNLLTDRMMLREMNNCGAGDTTLTLAPNGKFYVCPAFYYDDKADSVGDINAPDFRSADDLDVRNRQLYKLDGEGVYEQVKAFLG